MNSDLLLMALVGVTLWCLGLSWFHYRAVGELKDLRIFKNGYHREMGEMWRWFAGDKCSLLVLGYLDHRLDGGIADPAGQTRDELMFQGIQAVRQAVRDCHFNETLKARAETACTIEAARPRSVPDEITPMNIQALREAHRPGIEFDEYLAVCLAEIFKGGVVNIYHVSKQEQDALGNLVDGETRIYKITDCRGEQLWPSMYGSDESSSEQAQPSANTVNVTYHEQPLTYEERLDLILKGVQQLTARVGENNEMLKMVSARETYTANIVLDGTTGQAEGVRMAMRDLDLVRRPQLHEDEFTPRPSGWAVMFRTGEHAIPSWLTVLDGFTQDSRKALIFGSKEAAQASSATINSDRPQYTTHVAWVVYDGAEQRYVEHPMP